MKSSNLRQDLGQNIAQNLFFDTNSVGQLAKTPFPTEKISKNSTLSVSRQEKNTSRTRSRRYITRISNFEKYEYFEKPFKIRQSVSEDFLQTIPLLFRELEKTKVVFHNYKYIEEIINNYPKEQANLFIEWIKTFAILRQENRRFFIKNVIFSNEDDFLKTFKLFKFLILKRRRKTVKEKIFDLIAENFPYKTFSTNDIYPLSVSTKGQVRRHLNSLKDDKVLRKCKRINNTNYYKLITT